MMEGELERVMEHNRFQPELTLDPQQQKKLRAHLQQVDSAAFEANRQVLARTVGRIDLRTFQALATAAALARAHWVASALHVTEKGHCPSASEVAHLSALRAAFVELTEAYDAMRRMVERGYLCFLDRA
jgi:hypothetical protein